MGTGYCERSGSLLIQAADRDARCTGCPVGGIDFYRPEVKNNKREKRFQVSRHTRDIEEDEDGGSEREKRTRKKRDTRFFRSASNFCTRPPPPSPFSPFLSFRRINNNKISLVRAIVRRDHIPGRSCPNVGSSWLRSRNGSIVE